MREELIRIEHERMFQTYKRLPVVIGKAEGCRIYDEDGSEYLDFLGGIAVNALGHGHPEIKKAIYGQAEKYLHVSNYFYQEPQILLAQKIYEMTGFERVFFSNSGTEAIEGAIKLARRYGNARVKSEIVAFSGGFHGRTYGALSIMDKPKYKDGMGPFLPGTKVLPLNDISALESNINEQTCALFIEFLQGEGGICSPTQEFADKINELREKYGFLLVADEIQGGTGRTGKFFSFEHYAARPDVVTIAKGIGGGLPLGAILAHESLADLWTYGTHGTTYGGNALACASGMVVLQELEKGLMNHVSEIGDYFKAKLMNTMEQYPAEVLEVRGRGLMLGLSLSFDAGILVVELLRRNVITNAASGTVLRIVPPYIIEKNDVDEFILKLNESLKQINKESY